MKKHNNKIKNKNIILKIILVTLFIFISFIYNKEKVEASSSENLVKIYFVYNKIKLNSKDTLVINVNFGNYDKVKEIKLRIEKKENIEPLLSSDGYFDINDNTNFSNVLVNEYILNESINLHVIKENIEVTNYQNNICNISYLVTSDIENIIELFKDNIKIYLFDDKMQLLEYEIKHSEKLNATWDIENNVLEVYSNVPNFSDSFNVTNRSKGEYEIIVNQNVDSSILGMQAISIIVIDKVNYDYLVFNQAINIIDSMCPIVSSPDKITIKDTEINSLIIEKFIGVSDNYDLLPTLHITYLDKEENEISNLDEFKNYVRGENKAFIEVFSTDDSSNSSEKIKIEFFIEDVSAPIVILENIDSSNTIYIDDTKIDEFDLYSNFKINDNYDLSPNIIFNFFNNITNEKIENVLEELKKGTVIACEYYGIDNSNNKTNNNKVLLMVKDITIPVLNGANSIEIKDSEVENYDFLQNITCSDNIDQNPSLIVKYYINEEEYRKYDFLSKLKKGYNGEIRFIAVDKSLNYSEEYIQKVNVIDTTAPVITINDIKESGKYLKLEEIKYEVSDNFEQEVEVYVTLNEYEYTGTKITEVGNYTFKIVARDLAGNESVKELKFNIIEKNITGCGGDIDCYVDNYTTIIVVVTVLMLVSIGTIVFKVVYTIRKTKNNKNKLNISIDNHS